LCLVRYDWGYDNILVTLRPSALIHLLNIVFSSWWSRRTKHEDIYLWTIDVVTVLVSYWLLLYNSHTVQDKYFQHVYTYVHVSVLLQLGILSVKLVSIVEQTTC